MSIRTRRGAIAAPELEQLEPRWLLSAIVLGKPTVIAGGASFNGEALGSLRVAGINDLVDTTGTNTLEVRLGNGSGGFGAPHDYTVGNDPTGVAIGDLNHDGANDVVVANTGDGTLSVLLNSGDGGLLDAPQTYTVGPGPENVVIADLNGDGYPDLICSSAAGHTVSVLINKGNGTFYPQMTFPVGFVNYVAVGDVNHDGIPDIVGGDYQSNSVDVLLGKGDGTFKPYYTVYAGYRPEFTAVADVNGDGIDDIVAASFGSDSIAVLISNGDGTFKPAKFYPAATEISGLAVADFNNDGIADVATSSSLDQSVSVDLGNGDGTFAAPKTMSVGQPVGSIAAGSIAPDVLTDLVAGSSEGLVSVPTLRVAPAITLTSPTNGSENLTGEIDLTWDDTDASEYRVIVATNKADLPTDPASTATVPSAVVDDMSESSPYPINIGFPLSGNTTYYWEVQGLSTDPNFVTKFSSIFSFSTADTPPALPKIADAQIDVGTTFTTSGYFTDPDIGDSWTATINYGDGGGTKALGLHSNMKFILSHLYDTTGDFEVVLKIHDHFGGTGVAKFHVDVVAAGGDHAVRADNEEPISTLLIASATILRKG
jgi:hypothetical protein